MGKKPALPRPPPLRDEAQEAHSLLFRYRYSTDHNEHITREVLETVLGRWRELDARYNRLFGLLRAKPDADPAELAKAKEENLRENVRDWRKAAFRYVQLFYQGRGMDRQDVETVLTVLPLREPLWNTHAEQWEEEIVCDVLHVISADPAVLRRIFLVTDEVIELLKPWCEDLLIAHRGRCELQGSKLGDGEIDRPARFLCRSLWAGEDSLAAVRHRTFTTDP